MYYKNQSLIYITWTIVDSCTVESSAYCQKHVTIATIYLFQYNQLCTITQKK